MDKSDPRELPGRMTPSVITLRRATTADAPVIWGIRAGAIRLTCRGYYSPELLERWASSPLPETFPSRIENEYFIVGTIESRIVGFAALKISGAEVEAVFVAPDAGRRGVGRSLLADLESVALEAGLQELSLNSSLNAVPFYRAIGYNVVSEGTYTTSQGLEIACVRMRKPLEANLKR